MSCPHILPSIGIRGIVIFSAHDDDDDDDGVNVVHSLHCASDWYARTVEGHFKASSDSEASSD